MQNPILSPLKGEYTRRQFVKTAGIALAAAGSPFKSASSKSKNSFKAIVFDGFVIFNPKPVYALADMFFGDKSAELCALWRTKQFEYSWIRTAAKLYADFWHVTEDALVYAAKKTGVSLSSDHKAQLMNRFLGLDIWPDVLPGLKMLKDQGLSLSFLSNFTVNMMESSLSHNQLTHFFDHKLSTDAVGEFKPSPAAYQMGVDTLKLKKGEIIFAAFGAWDAAGAKLFGYPTFWVNRAHSQAEELGIVPDGVGYNLKDLLSFAKG
ncbi:haloacid dehalogenase type II [Mucilaginibacter sp. L3T2-6]|uniref:haloacid dehalogenase type II n=1 Tax=Mucilaginibacter sp. L3T2-6 TaxID=3062491 RepID=UPI002676D3BF|nr:haloacid dehalogenase type II [Mucilaginibacter sp. L3T2-6]MDO3642397.1 haloacid dehalogenase type II [Mucilaginibacter sp. L3T2-6]MDV6214892.1 haloacid dehalogenase type II [Mucilaginibacter sp. L3T2-6]